MSNAKANGDRPDHENCWANPCPACLAEDERMEREFRRNAIRTETSINVGCEGESKPYIIDWSNRSSVDKKLIEAIDRNSRNAPLAHTDCVLGVPCQICLSDRALQRALETVAPVIFSDYVVADLLPWYVQNDLNGAEADHEAEVTLMFERPFEDEFYGWHPDDALAEQHKRIVIRFVSNLLDAEMLSYEHAELLDTARGVSR